MKERMLTHLWKLHHELYLEVEAISDKYDCKVRERDNGRGLKIVQCYGKPLSNEFVRTAKKDHNNTCCLECPHLNPLKGCTVRNLACKVFFCMPVIKKIQKKNFKEYMIMTAFKTVLNEGHFFSQHAEILYWIFRRDYFRKLRNQYSLRKGSNDNEKFVIKKTINICDKLIEAIAITIKEHGMKEINTALQVCMEMENLNHAPIK